MPRRSKLVVPAFLILISIIFSGKGAAQNQRDHWERSVRWESSQHQRRLPVVRYAQVERVMDGDTIQLVGGERVRLLGVDTPETVHPAKPVQYYGLAAKHFTTRLATGRRVRLEFDWPLQDKYGRTLAYVFLDDNLFLNAELIRQGYGFAYRNFPCRYLNYFIQLEDEARFSRRGLWSLRSSIRRI